MRRFPECTRRVLRFILAHMDRRGFPPTLAEIARKHKYSTTAAKYHLDRLERDGYIRRRPRSARAIEIIDLPRALADSRRPRIERGENEYLPDAG